MYFIFRKKFRVSDIVFYRKFLCTSVNSICTPPEMISVVSFGIYFSRFLTVSVLEPITAIFINKALPLFMNPLWVHFYIIAQEGLIINP